MLPVQGGDAEAVLVARAVAGIALLMVMVAALRTRTPVRPALLLPFQMLFHELPAAEQVPLRELWVAVEELAAFREAEGRWAAPAELAERAIPPFAPLLLAHGELRYEWRVAEQEEVTTYGGCSPGRPSLLLRLERSPPLADAAHRALVGMDGFHLKLLDGSVFHYSLWWSPDARAPLPGPRPELSGWRQVVTAAP